MVSRPRTAPSHPPSRPTPACGGWISSNWDWTGSISSSIFVLKRVPCSLGSKNHNSLWVAVVKHSEECRSTALLLNVLMISHLTKALLLLISQFLILIHLDTHCCIVIYTLSVGLLSEHFIRNYFILCCWKNHFNLWVYIYILMTLCTKYHHRGGMSGVFDSGIEASP